MGSIYKRGKIWQFSYLTGNMKPGKDGKLRPERITKSLDTTDEKLAKDLKKENEVKLKKGLLHNPQKKDKETFRAEYEATISTRKERTNETELCSIDRFLKDSAKGNITAVTTNDIRSYLIGFENKAPQTYNNTLGAIKRFFKLAVDSGYILKNPADGIKRKKMPKNPPKFYSDEDFHKIERVLEGKSPDPNQVPAVKPTGKVHFLYPMVMTARYTGLRLGELIHLEWQDFDLVKKQVRVLNKPQYNHTIKNHQSRVVPISDQLIDKLLPYIPWGHKGICFPKPKTQNLPAADQIYSIQGPKTPLRKILRKAGLPKRKREGWHDFRHTFGSVLGQKGVPMQKIKEWMGHSSLAVTEIYVRMQHGYDSDIEKLNMVDPVRDPVKEPVKEAASV